MSHNLSVSCAFDMQCVFTCTAAYCKVYCDTNHVTVIALDVHPFRNSYNTYILPFPYSKLLHVTCCILL